MANIGKSGENCGINGAENLDSSQAFDSVLTSLQPLQDLAKNWDIDISTSLEEYLRELTLINSAAIVGAKTSFENEHEHSSLNFAQAALLVQSSSHVYSRKVDFLYKLVYKQLEELAAQTSNSGNDSKANNKRLKTIDSDVDEFLNFDPNQDFLLLDDILPTIDRIKIGKKNSIDLIESDPNEHIIDSIYFKGRRSSIHLSSSDTSNRLSLGGITGITQITNTSCDRTSSGGCNSATRRALIGTLDSCSNLRLVQGGSDVGEDGILLIPGAVSGNLYNIRDDPVNIDLVSVSGENNQATFQKSVQFVDYDDNDNDVDAGFQFSRDVEAEVLSLAPHEIGTLTVSGDNTSDKNRNSLTVLQKVPWSLLDPHFYAYRAQKPLRLGKTILYPPGIHNMPSDGVTGSSTKMKFTHRDVARHNARPLVPTRRLQASDSFQATIARKRNLTEISVLSVDYERSFGNSMNPFTVPLQGLVLGNEFAYIAAAIAKRKAAERRYHRKLMRNEQQQDLSFSMEKYNHSQDCRDDDCDLDERGGFEFFSDIAPDGDDGQDENIPSQNPESLEMKTVTNTGLRSIEEIFQSDGRKVGLQDDPGQAGSTFEDLCRAHIQKFARGAEKYAIDTQLSYRVGKWQSRLKPILEEEENRPVFDIHEYGAHVIDILEKTRERQNSCLRVANQSNASKLVDFREVCKNLPSHEVSRMFLASLSLCNSGNIIFEETHERENPSSSLFVNLLKSETARPTAYYSAKFSADKQTY